jgi:hypothetical protein
MPTNTGKTINQLPEATQPQMSWKIAIDTGSATFNVSLQQLMDLFNPNPQRHYLEDFSGQIFTLPLTFNGGNLPSDDNRIRVFFAGSRGFESIGSTDYTLIRKTNLPDEIHFTNSQSSENILIEIDPIISQ